MGWPDCMSTLYCIIIVYFHSTCLNNPAISLVFFKKKVTGVDVFFLMIIFHLGGFWLFLADRRTWSCYSESFETQWFQLETDLWARIQWICLCRRKAERKPGLTFEPQSILTELAQGWQRWKHLGNVFPTVLPCFGERKMQSFLLAFLPGFSSIGAAYWCQEPSATAVWRPRLDSQGQL